MFETVLYAGLANWLCTWILVEGVVFDDLRAWLDRHVFVGTKYQELWKCHLCCGTWLGFVLAFVLWFQGIAGPFGAQWYVIPMNGFVYKAVGHLILEMAAYARHNVAIAEHRAQAESRATLKKVA